MKYLIKKPGLKGYLKSTAHIWLENDTACKMASTRGIHAENYDVSESTNGREICTMCRNVYGGEIDDSGFNLL